jgi:hypothetical protein
MLVGAIEHVRLGRPARYRLAIIDRDALADAVTRRIGREIAAKSWRKSMSAEREGRDAIVIVQTTAKMFLCAAANNQ